MGPIVKNYDPIVDYGLVKVNTTQTFEITLENQSPINAEIVLKKSENKRLNFHNMISASTTSLVQTDSSTASLIFDKPFKTKGDNVVRMDHYSL